MKTEYKDHWRTYSEREFEESCNLTNDEAYDLICASIGKEEMRDLIMACGRILATKHGKGSRAALLSAASNAPHGSNAKFLAQALSCIA